MKRIFCLVIASACSASHADVYTWSWEPGDGGSFSNSGGAFESVWGSYDAVSRTLAWEIAFSDRIAEGFTLALNDGPNPKGNGGELGLVYFDATDVSNVRVSAFAYNGMNTQTSYRDGSALYGTQSPDLIFGVSPLLENAPSILEASVLDDNAGRRLRLVLEATLINAHTPAYPGEGGAEDWFGIGFGSSVGVWLHPVTSLTTEYDDEGVLSYWSGRQGWLDGANFAADVPAPGIAGVGVAGLTLASRRRRGR